MNSIAFVDTEIDPNSKRILDIGSVANDGRSFHKSSVVEFVAFLNGMQFACGHNIFNHDLKYIGDALSDAQINPENIVDTLFLSPLLFPTNPYHALLKDDKLQSEERNDPVADAVKARDLLHAEIAAFRQLDALQQNILYQLLHDKKEFAGFFRLIAYKADFGDAANSIRIKFQNEICGNANLAKLISGNAVELAYCLALISSFTRHKNVHSITPPWVLKNYPEVERILFLLRNQPCVSGCAYCNEALDVTKGLKRFFGFDQFRTYAGEPLQQKAVKAAVDAKSILAVFPTGGGKSLTFQLPALMSSESSKGLTVVISPLQSLMKDQVDNLEKIGITDAVTINGLLDPIEKAKAFERIESGSASILYLSPESLRSRTVERLILGRKIARFVIDEAHCFSSWGQDFRVDYLYIGDFIKAIQQKKNLEDAIPVSCFTATAKQKVIEDIREYFSEKLSLDLELFTSNASRTNLRYKVFAKENEDEKYQMLRNLIEEKNCPTIIYVSRTKKAKVLARKLQGDGFDSAPYHGKMDAQQKTGNQNAFISGEIPIMVATSAFGMGVDKKDIGLVIHYEISDSLENYLQEAGRAGRDEKITADCYVMYNEEDLGKHFILLNQTKLSIKEIQQVWKAIKEITRFRPKVSNSALEIARKAGWDENVDDIETRVKTAIAALEQAGYVKRGQNMPRVFANSILSRNAQEATNKIKSSEKIEAAQKEKAVRIIKKLFSSKSRKQNNDELAESRVDYIGDHLGIAKEEVIKIVNLLREENILADAKDLTAFVKRGENKNRPLKVVEDFSKIELFLLSQFEQGEKTFHLKELNGKAEMRGCEDVTINKLKCIVNFWAVKGWIRRRNLKYSKNHIAVAALAPREILREKFEKRHELAQFLIQFLCERSVRESVKEEMQKDEMPVEFSVHELKSAYENSENLFKVSIGLDDIEDALFYLSRIEAIKIDGGFLVTYNRLAIERLEKSNSKFYTRDDYKKLNQFYEGKVQQIHIVGEYAKKMLNDPEDAAQFAQDYFQLNHDSFLRKYFPGSKMGELKLKMTPGKFRQLFGDLSPAQSDIINDGETRYIVVAAGPGSGKTKVLVHKLASLIFTEDVKKEQLLMLTFSRAAATEFRQRLQKLIGGVANYVEIKTFHSYCFDLLGKVGSLEKSDAILRKTIEKIKNKEVEPSRITKTVLVIDEAQDMDHDEFELVATLMQENEEMRVIAVGDDDQNIYGFRGASSKYLERFIEINDAAKHELVENYRSKRNLVDFSNQFARQIAHRLKQKPIVAKQTDNGKIKIVRYQSNNLVTPLASDILATGLKGTTCALVKTNEEALQLAGLLLRNGLQVKLVQTNESFNLYNLLEVRFFLETLRLNDDVFVVSDEIWAGAKQKLNDRFAKSTKLELCNNAIKKFDETYPKKYRSDLESFFRESKLEDFYDINGETIFVSTIHKAKGREFDNVFLMLENFHLGGDDEKRQLYVAMTRAKTNLTVHLNSGFLDTLTTENLERVRNDEIFAPPDEMVAHMTHKDVYLDYFIERQDLVSALTSGDALFVNDSGCTNANGQQVLRFSGHFKAEIEKMKSKNYALKKAKVNFVVYWLREGADRETKILLPELYFGKSAVGENPEA